MAQDSQNCSGGGKEHSCGCHGNEERHICSSANDGCQHNHDHGEPTAKPLSFRVGGGVALCRLTSHEEAHIVSCVLELDEDIRLSGHCLAYALKGLACDVEKQGGIVGHIKCAAADGCATVHISVAQANVEPTIVAANLDELGSDADISLACIVYGIEHGELLEMLLTRLECMF